VKSKQVISTIQIALVALSPFVLAAGCSRPPSRAAQSSAGENSKVVSTEIAGHADLSQILVFPVDLAPSTQVTVSSLVAERIVALDYDNGDPIEAGAVLATIRADQLKQGVTRARADLRSLDAQLKNQKDEVARAKQLYDGEVITRQSYDATKSSYAANKARRRALKAAVEQASLNLDNAEIVATISGVVANKRVEAGDMVAPGAPICDIMAIDTLEVTLDVPEREAFKVRVGQEVSLALDALPGRQVRGEVSRVLPYLDTATRANAVEVRIPNPAVDGERPLKPGLFGRASLVVAERPDAVVVSERALTPLDSADDATRSLRSLYLVGEGGRVEERLVRTGIHQGELVEITEGLARGERVVTRGQRGLNEGDPVEVVDEPSVAIGEHVAEDTVELGERMVVGQ
jgi:membrane fusion protein (multidrug efflux system)